MSFYKNVRVELEELTPDSDPAVGSYIRFKSRILQVQHRPSLPGISTCIGCFFGNSKYCDFTQCCGPFTRDDGDNVIFKDVTV